MGIFDSVNTNPFCTVYIIYIYRNKSFSVQTTRIKK